MADSGYVSDSDFYRPKEVPQTTVSDEELARQRTEFAKGGAQRYEEALASRSGGSGTGDNERESQAYEEIGNHGLPSADLINSADQLQREAVEALAAARLQRLQEEKEESLAAQRSINDRGTAAVRKELGMLPKASDVLTGHSPEARRVIEAARLKGEQARKAAEPRASWPADQLIQTPQEARDVGKQLSDQAEHDH